MSVIGNRDKNEISDHIRVDSGDKGRDALRIVIDIGHIQNALAQAIVFS